MMSLLDDYLINPVQLPVNNLLSMYTSGSVPSSVFLKTSTAIAQLYKAAASASGANDEEASVYAGLAMKNLFSIGGLRTVSDAVGIVSGGKTLQEQIADMIGTVSLE